MLNDPGEAPLDSILVGLVPTSVMQAAAPYQIGFQTQDQEREATPLAVNGSLPGWLSGSLLRTGPARFEAGSQSYRHWFDGLAMLHRFDLADGRVLHASRYLRSKNYEADSRKGRIAQSGFASDPSHTLFSRARALFFPRLPDNGNVNVVCTAGSFAALPETPLPVHFDPRTLKTLARPTGKSALSGHLTTAHPQYDAARNRSYNYLLKFGRRSVYQIVAIDETTGATSLLASIPMDEPCYVHSIGMSANYVVIAFSPLVVDPLALRANGKPFIQNYRWCPERGLRFAVIDKQDGRIVREARADARFTFHHVNAFEEDGAVVADLIAFPDATIIDQLYLDRLRSGTPVLATGNLMRYRIPIGAGEVDCRPLSTTQIELPRINAQRCAGHPYRWIFAGGNQGGDFIDSIVKIDTHSGQADNWCQPGCYPGEPVFVPAPDASAEDDGVLLSVVLDAGCQTSFLLALDAATLREIARANIAQHIPFGTHGDFFAALAG